MRARLISLWLVLMMLGSMLHDAGPSLASTAAPPPTPTLPVVANTATSAGAYGVTVGTGGGTVDLPDGGSLAIPSGALAAQTVFSRYSVEMRQAGGLARYHPMAQAVHVEAATTAASTAVTSLQSSATLTLNVKNVAKSLLKSPAVRVQSSTGWDQVPSTYDQSAGTLTISVASLPVTVAAVDNSEPESLGDWDPSDPAGIQLPDGSWSVAYTDATNPAHTFFRRYLGTQNPPYWLPAVTVDTGANQYDTPVPAAVMISNTLALFYRKATGGVKQVFLRTSTDYGKTWSSATQLTTESVDIYQIQASVVSGTVYVFYSLSNTSGTLQYITSSDLSTWTPKATVGQAIGPLQNSTYPTFDIKQLGSGNWLMAWLNVSQCTGSSYCNNLSYPVVWTATSSSLGSSSWSNAQEVTQPINPPYYNRYDPGYTTIAQTSSGTVYLGYTMFYRYYDTYGYYRTSSDGGATWSGETVFAYEPSRGTTGSQGVTAIDLYFALDSSGNIRAFWDQSTSNGWNTFPDNYPTQLFRRDLPSGAIIPVSDVKEVQSQCSTCVPWAAFGADPVNVTTGNFTLPETDISIPARGPALAFQRSYNSLRLADGPLGFGWTDNYSTTLSTFTQGEVLIVDGSGRVDLYTPAGGGVYNPPPGFYSTLVHNGDGTWTLTEKDQSKKNFSSSGQLVSIADRNGNSLSLSYNGSGQLSSVSDAAGRSLTFGYTGSHITSITDPLSRTVSFGYDGSGDLTSVTDMRGKSWSYTYDSSHRLLTKVDPNNHTVLTNTYGGLDRVTSQSDANNAQTSFQYSGSGGSTTKIDPLGNSTVYNYDTQYRTTQVNDAYGKSVYYTYDTSNNLTQVRDARTGINYYTYFTYDSRNNLLTKKNNLNNVWSYWYNSNNDVITTTNPLGYTSVYTYNTAGNLTSVTDPLGETTNFGRDSYGQLTSVTDARGKTSAFGYDSYGDPVSSTNPYSKTWTTAYDLGGRKTSVTDPLSHTVSYGYDNNNNLTSTTDGRSMVTSYGYDDANNRTSVTDPNNNTTNFAYDAKNRVITVTNALTGTTVYGYDANDNLTSLQDANNHSRSWNYDKDNRVITETDSLGFATHNTYDAAGNLTNVTTPNGGVITNTYDTLYRLTSTQYPTVIVSYGYDAANRRTSMTDATGQTTYAYDKLDRLTSVTEPGNRVVAYQYDPAGNRTSITYPDGKAVNYTYDDANRMSSVTDWITNTTSFGYDDAGRLTSTSFPTGVSESRGYNNADQLTSIAATKGGNTLTSFNYTLDNAGVRTAVQDLTGTESYGYDQLYRTTAVTYTDGITQTYSYDAVGNRLSLVQGGNTITSTYDAGDRLTSSTGTTYTYDNNGNETTRSSGGTTTTYCWDVFNRLKGATDSQATPACPVADPVRINSGGGSYQDVSGNTWAPDGYFSGGLTGNSTAPIANTNDDPLYQYYRYGFFSYAIPLPASGNYTVTLKFNEPSMTAAGQRVFNVSMEGTQVLSNFDIYATAGGKNIALDESIPVTVTDGMLNISFSQVTNNPIVSAIEVDWAGSPPATPTATYTYRADGLRNTKTSSGITTTYTWDLNSSLPEVLQDGTETYVYGPLGLVSQTDGSGNQQYFLDNGLGSTEALTDGSGNIVATYKYDVFGAVRSSTGSGSTDFRFTGQQNDAAVGYTYLRARYYDPATGRFLSKDPVRGVLTNPPSFNYYVYAQSNPANWRDPSGKTLPLAIIGGLLGAAVGAGAELLSCSATNSCDTGKVLMSAGIGAAVGATAGLTLGASIPMWIAVGGGASAVGNAANQVIVQGHSRDTFDWGSFGLAAGSGALGGAFGGAMVANPLSRSLSELPGSAGPWMGERIEEAAGLTATTIGFASDIGLQTARESGLGDQSFQDIASGSDCGSPVAAGG